MVTSNPDAIMRVFEITFASRLQSQCHSQAAAMAGYELDPGFNVKVADVMVLRQSVGAAFLEHAVRIHQADRPARDVMSGSAGAIDAIYHERLVIA